MDVSDDTGASGYFIPEEREHVTHSMEDSVDTEANFGSCGVERKFFPLPGIGPRAGQPPSSPLYRLSCYLLSYSVALVRKRTIPIERPPIVDEVSANFCGQRDGSLRLYSRLSRPISIELYCPKCVVNQRHSMPPWLWICLPWGRCET
jgi:hypothetical protein